MFSAGLVMVTDAGIFIFQLMDNHAATYSALIIGCSEVSVAAAIIYLISVMYDDLAKRKM